MEGKLTEFKLYGANGKAFVKFAYELRSGRVFEYDGALRIEDKSDREMIDTLQTFVFTKLNETGEWG
ncbi:hypothetical protein HXA35_20395 [Bacillus sp. A301a_S52]|jgi:hypothetical protein|nr:hypothetical protein [Bacillus sp. A301a_S52]MCR6112693.1 hypothetical protein [Bacillus sp. A301a_S52]